MICLIENLIIRQVLKNKLVKAVREYLSASNKNAKVCFEPNLKFVFRRKKKKKTRT